jgi:hypothetical protein
MKPMYSVLVILASFMSVAFTSGRMQDAAKSAAPVAQPNTSEPLARSLNA